MEKNITSSVTITTANALTVDFNHPENGITERVINIIGSFTDETIKRAVNESLSGMDICGKVLNYTETTIKYTMPESEFFTKAKAVEKRSNGNYIYRTLKGFKYNVSVYNNENGTVEPMIKTTKTELDKFSARKAFKELETESLSIVGVFLIDTIENGYQMETSEFIKYATKTE